jgi:hypothetical protein
MPIKPSNTQFRWLILSYGFFILLMTLAAFYWRYHNNKYPPQSHQETLLPVSQSPSVDLPGTIEVGLLVDNIYNFEADKKTFDANGWVWLKWSSEIEREMKVQGLSVQQLFYFYNQVGDWDLSLTSGSENPVKMSDGRYYQRFRFSGHFYANELDFRKYPFQTIKLPMALELNPGKFEDRGQRIQMVIDQKNSGIGSYIDLGGYLTTGFTLTNYLHRYESSLGEPGITDETKQVPQARMEVSYEKALVATVLKLLLPLITVMALALFSPSISSSGWDVRVGIPPTALLTLIFLQQTYQTWLPELSYITFLDSVYNICYYTNLMLFGLFLWGTNEYSMASEAEKPAVVERIDRIDRYFQVILVTMLVIGISGNWFFIADRAN